MNQAKPQTMPGHCSECGAAFSANSGRSNEGGPCPACLMKLGMASWQENQSLQQFGLEPTIAGSNKIPESIVSVEDLAEKFPQYELLHLVGVGGMGTVYCAKQTSLNRLVALKVIKPEANKRAEFADRFIREARAMGQLNHQNIVTVHDFGQIDDIYYFVMEYVDGINLRQMLKGNKLSAQHALEIVPAICDALQYAHDMGIVHRDIKPENIMIDTNGVVKIADFGLAKLMDQEATATQLTQANHIMGTMHYMAPEQIETPLSVDHRADIYSLGVVIYELLTGELPLGRFAPPSHKVTIDVRLDEIVLQTLAKEPALRYQRVSDVKSELSSVSSQPPEPQFDNNRLYERGVEVVVRNGRGSIGLLQRELGVTEARAMHLMERMSNEGVVGPVDDGNHRAVNYSVNELASMRKFGTSPIPAAVDNRIPGKPPVQAAQPGQRIRKSELPGPIPNCGMLASIVHPGTWLNVVYLLLALPLGIIYFVFTVVGLSVGFSTLIVWIGIPVLLLTFTGVRTFMFFDRSLTRALLRTRVPDVRVRVPDESKTAMDQAKELAFSAETWRGIVYLFSKLILGILSFTFGIVFVCLPLSMILSPLGVILFDGNVDFIWLEDFPASMLLCMLGLLLAPCFAWCINRMAWLNAEWARLCLIRK